MKTLYIRDPVCLAVLCLIKNEHQSYLAFSAYNEFPRDVFVTHNHLDHAGELPMLFVYESKRSYLAYEPRLKVLSEPEVEYKLKTHGLDEMLSMFKP